MPTILDELANLVDTSIAGLLSKNVRAGVTLRRGRIDGIEATQTIQYYQSDQHLTDPATRGTDNAVVLAAYKPAWVRVYVRSGGAVPLNGVRGTLTVERRRNGIAWQAVSTLTPQAPGWVIASPTTDYATERGSVFNSLNFVIPAANCWGILRLTATITDAAGATLDTSSVTVHATLVQTLRLRGMLFSYNGPSTSVVTPGVPPTFITIAAPTLADLQTTASRALLAMPVQSTGNFASAGTPLILTFPLDDPRSGPGGCSPNWGTLLTTLAERRTADGNRADVVYFGLLPKTVPINVPGCGSDGVGAGKSGDVGTLLHEIGHGYGFQHTPCGAAGTTDANYPNYKPYPSASIGEYGLDISTGNVFPPNSTSDYMSYCFPQWMSLYQHERLVGHPRLDPSWLSDSPIWDNYVPWREYNVARDLPYPADPWTKAQNRADPVISIIGVVHSEKEIEVTSVARVPAMSTPPGIATDMRARLMDANGRELARAPIYQLDIQGGGCGCDGTRKPGEPPYTFQAMVADVAPGAALTISAGERVVWERRAPERMPEIGTLSAEHAGEHEVRLRWGADATAEHDVWAQWSPDDGATWQALATQLKGTEAVVDVGSLPAGEVLVRVLVHDGFFTGISQNVRVTVPPQRPLAAILHPADGQKIQAGGTLRLWGSATDNTGRPLMEDASRWLLDGREVARGTDTWLVAPEEGQHTAVLIVRADGMEAESRTRFTTIHMC